MFLWLFPHEKRPANSPNDSSKSNHVRATNSPLDLKRWRTVIHKGLPSEMYTSQSSCRRPEAWRLICNTEQYLSIFNEGMGMREVDLYWKLVRTPDREREREIEKDVRRTFPGNPNFQLACDSGNNQLYNILKAYSQHDVRVGYCQGMNYIAGMLLLHLEDERLAYLCFLYVMFENNWRELYTPNMKRLHSLIDELTLRLKKRVPAVYEHFRKQDVSMVGLFSHIFLTAFVYKAPLEFSVRMFDLFLLDKEEALISCVVKIMNLMQERILEHQSLVLVEINGP